MSTLIGGHDGLEVWRDGDQIIKRALDDLNRAGITNEMRFLRLLAGTGAAPALISIHDSEIIEEAIEDQGVVDGEAFRRNCARLLMILRDARVRNGDLTPPNIVVRHDRPVAVDWQQSHRFDEPYPDRHTSDSYLLWRTAASMAAREHPTPDTPRVIRRWMAVSGDLGGWTGTEEFVGKRLLDLGCFMGDFCALAAADGMTAVGVDANPDALASGGRIWGDLGIPVQLRHANILALQPSDFAGYDAILLFSVWPYLLQQMGRNAAERVIDHAVVSGAILYFECQLKGDGPGPDFFVEDNDILGFLSQFGPVRSLTTIPVTGRAASRTVWRVGP